ncbi:hypothetical protein B7R54_15905 [Subtercola boreus]|uniref:Uncharacterized protein n=1 Tax=Subtercola boreus TaxID=120213 RepID=A0A3E0VKM6_9MICO|nr:hypothetical protein [Subtercola boreus]RFA10522.1 hypothetical protein B7R54_15905 [Subtercola boreus]
MRATEVTSIPFTSTISAESNRVGWATVPARERPPDVRSISRWMSLGHDPRIGIPCTTAADQCDSIGRAPAAMDAARQSARYC